MKKTSIVISIILLLLAIISMSSCKKCAECTFTTVAHYPRMAKQTTVITKELCGDALKENDGAVTQSITGDGTGGNTTIITTTCDCK